MKTILFIVVLTIVYIVGMTKFTDNQDYYNSSRFAALEAEYGITFDESDIGDSDSETSSESILTISFTGQVSKKTSIKVAYGSTMNVALDLAGGLLDSADERAVNLNYVLVEDMSFYIPSISSNEKVSINDGDEDELTSLPSIGTVTADKIIAYREANGDFSYLEEIKNVSGIGATTFEKIKDYIIL